MATRPPRGHEGGVSVRRLLHNVRLRIAVIWKGLRALSGDAAWEVYVERCVGRPQLSREAFYLDRVQHKYHRPCRCC